MGLYVDDKGRLAFSMSGPCTVEQVECVEAVGHAIGLQGHFDALVGWWRGPDNMHVDVPLLKAINCAYEMGRGHERAGPLPIGADQSDGGRYTDPNLAGVHIELQTSDADATDMTNAAVLLVRADQLQADESGEHPGKRFAMVSITRAELLRIQQLLEDDWQDHCRFADPLADDAPLLTTQARGRVDVLLSLLGQAAEVLDTIEPEDSAEADKLGALLGHMREAVTAWRGEHG